MKWENGNKTSQDERFSCPFLNTRTNVKLWTKRLIEASKTQVHMMA